MLLCDIEYIHIASTHWKTCLMPLEQRQQFFSSFVWMWQVAQLQNQQFYFSWNLFGLKQFQHHLVSLSTFHSRINTLEYYYLWMYYGDFPQKELVRRRRRRRRLRCQWTEFIREAIQFFHCQWMYAHTHTETHAFGGNNVPWNNMFNIYFYCTNGFSYRISPFSCTIYNAHSHTPTQQLHAAC